MNFKLIADNTADNAKKIVLHTAQKLGKKIGKNFSQQDIENVTNTALKTMEDLKSQPSTISETTWTLARWLVTWLFWVLTLKSEEDIFGPEE